MAKDGSLEDRSTLKPDRNNFGPRLGIAYTPTDRTVIRGGYGISYVHFHRAGGANVLPINGPQVINAVVVQTPADADVPDDAAGLSGGADRSGAVQSAAGQHHLHAERLSLERRAQLVRVGAARDVGRRAARPRLRRQSRQRHAAVRELQPGGAEQRRRHAVAAVAAADPGVRRHHLLVQRRQVALPLVPDQVRLAHRPRHDAAELADAVADQGQRRRLAREPERQFPGAAGLQQPRRRLRLLGVSPAVQQHDQLRDRSAVRPAAAGT